ncbi:MAG: hypothetical protein JWO86_7134 [Myxococcaceae bacterium]|nr:hypothetical protein [Myxococcaceae bacterium]
MHPVDRFDARAVTWFLRLYGLALVVDVASEIAAGVWHVHTGRFYPWRNLGIVPLYPAGVLAVEWTLRAGAGLALLAGATRAKVVAAAIRVAALVLFVAVLERYSNHGVLLFLVAFFLTLAPPDVSAPDFRDRAHPALGLVRAQLVIVYVFSALNKLAHGFGSGRSLGHLLGGPSPALATMLSLLVIATELAIPLVLVLRPRAGIALVVAMHAAFALLVPGVISFGVAMTAVAVLFASRPRSSSP